MKKVLLLLFVTFLTINGFTQNIFYLGISVEKLFGLNEKGYFTEDDVPIEFSNSNGFVFSVNPIYSFNNKWLFESGINLVHRKHNITLLSSRGDLTDTRPYYNLEIPFNIGYRIPIYLPKGISFYIYGGLTYRIKQVDDDFPGIEASDYEDISGTFRAMRKTVSFNHALFYSAKFGIRLPENSRVFPEIGFKYSNSFNECNSVSFHYSNEGQSSSTANYSSKTNYITIYLKVSLLLTKPKNEKL